MADGIREVGKGFFNTEGSLKTSEALAKEATASVEKIAKSAGSEEASTSSVVTNAVGAVRSRFNESANNAASEINKNEDILERSERVVKDQLKNTRELKQALDNKDTEKADKIRERLAKLDGERAELAKKSEELRKERGNSNEVQLRLGNKEAGERVKIKTARVEERKTADIDRPREAKEAVADLKSDLQDIRAQRAELKSARSSLTETVKETKAEIDDVEERSIRSISEAEKRSKNVASQIQADSAGAVNVSKISADIVRSLTT